MQIDLLKPIVLVRDPHLEKQGDIVDEVFEKLWKMQKPAICKFFIEELQHKSKDLIIHELESELKD